jgi:hypothetical protein
VSAITTVAVEVVVGSSVAVGAAGGVRVDVGDGGSGWVVGVDTSVAVGGSAVGLAVAGARVAVGAGGAASSSPHADDKKGSARQKTAFLIL